MVSFSTKAFQASMEEQPIQVGLAVGLISVMGLYVISSSSNSNKNRNKNLPDGVSYPPHVSSWIPFLGKAIEFGTSLHLDFVLKYRKACGESPVFTALIAGKKCAFVTDANLAPPIFREMSTKLDSLSLQEGFMRRVCAVPSACDGLGKWNSSRQYYKQFVHRQLMRLEGLRPYVKDAQEILLDHINEWIMQDKTKSDTEWHQAKLHEFCRKIVFKGSAGPLISKSIIDRDDILQDFLIFEGGIPLLFADAPAIVTKHIVEARERLVSILSRNEVTGSSSLFVRGHHTIIGSDGLKKPDEDDDEKKNREKVDTPEPTDDGTLVDEDYGDDEFNFRGRLNLALLVGAIGNSMPSIFWVMCHLMADPEALKACREEVDAVIAKRQDGTSGDGRLARDSNGRVVLEPFTIEELDEMPILHSTFYESLRWASGSITVREVISDFIINPAKDKRSVDPAERQQQQYMIEKGTRLMLVGSVIHYDEDLFENPKKFQYDRFLVDDNDAHEDIINADEPPADEKKKKKRELCTKKVSYLRAFGGGAHYCSGRKFIANQTKALLAMMVVTMDLKLQQPQQQPSSSNGNNQNTSDVIPGIDFGRQGITINSPDRDPIFEWKVREMM